MKIGNKEINEKSPCFIIAEAGANFRISKDIKKNFDHAIKLIDLAAKSGSDAVKFQLYKAKKLYVKNAGYADYLGEKKSIYKIIEEMELPYDWLKKLKKHCDKKKIIFLCTPFDEKSVDELEKINIQAYKIASYTITHLPLIKYIAKKKKPIIISTGASNTSDIQIAINTIRKEGNHLIAIMQCTAKYPAPLSTINLRSIPYLAKKFNTLVGLSDHSREISIAPIGAVALGAKIIEKHFTTDNSLPGPDHSFAILDKELAKLVKDIRKIELCLGKEKKSILYEEKELYKFARRSIFTIQEIEKGDIFTQENIAVLRSGKQEISLKPVFYEKILGKKSNKKIGNNQAIKEEDFK